jgi:hypothetical protein
MTIEEIVESRRISEIVHFTTHLGLTGVLHQRTVKARSFLQNDLSLEFILKLNTKKVFDARWKGYVNLSVSRINKALFGYSENWHPEQNWRILAFDPMILTHPDVHFVTTNNAYSQHLKRGKDAAALEALFASEVAGIYGETIRRKPGTPDNYTTDVQAEVLYPHSLSTEFLRKVYVRTQAEADEVAGLFSALQHPEVPITVEPHRF